MSLLLHISDAHFGTEREPVVAALLTLADERKPDVLIFSGDVTQRARADQFAAARRFCDQLGIRTMMVVPGNHDIPLFNLAARISRPYRGYLKAFGPTMEPVIDSAALLAIGVNTTRATRHKNGVVSTRQIESVAQRLSGAGPGQLRIVVTHQPAAVCRTEDEHDRLRGAEPALQAWSRAGADLVLGGHIHLPYVLDLVKRPVPTPRPMWCVQAGTAVSARVRHGTSNSVNLIHWKPGAAGAPRTCEVERCDYGATVQQFVTTEVERLLLGS